MKKTDFDKVTAEHVACLREIVGDDNVLLERFDLEPYSHDETEDFVFYPEVVVKPSTTGEVSEILALCNEANIPVTTRGGGTGLSGGALPVYGGVILSTERMNRIIEIDRENLMATVEPGLITHQLHQAVEELGLFYPVDPASKESCTIGGNVAECAGGPRAVKYGVTRDYVYGLTCVMPDGRVFKTGGKLLKNVTGYNLTQLIVGSEGTLCVVTEIILKLLPLPLFKRTMLAPFDSLTRAAQALTGIFNARIVPRAAEFIEQRAIKAAEEKLGKPFPHSDSAALLLFEIDGNREDILDEQAEKIGEICVEHGAIDVFVADNPERQAELWQMRRNIGEAVKSIAIYKEEDTVVPRSRLPELVREDRGHLEKVRHTDYLVRPRGRWQYPCQYHQEGHLRRGLEREAPGRDRGAIPRGRDPGRLDFGRAWDRLGTEELPAAGAEPGGDRASAED